MKALTFGCLFGAILVASSLCAQDEPLGDVAWRSRAESEAQKSNPNLRPPILMDGTSSQTCCVWDESDQDLSGAKEFVNRGLALDRQGRYPEALAQYRKALELRPDYARAYYDIGVVKDEQGKKEDATSAYNHALALDQSHYMVFENLGKVLIETGRYVEAEDVLRRGLSLFPGKLEIMMNLGNALGSQRKFEVAIPYFRRILDVAPDWGNARQSLCYALLQLGRPEEAAKVRAEWPSYRPNSPENCADCSQNK
jgi:tetratricopeptide (TPR) repeat protein